LQLLCIFVLIFYIINLKKGEPMRLTDSIQTLIVMCIFGFLMAISIPSNGLASLLSGPIYNPTTGMNYYLLDQSTWTQAQAEAEALGGNLVTIDNQSENNWIIDNFGTYGNQNRNLWIGLHSVGTPGNFGWVDGGQTPYRNWAPGEPNFIEEKYVYIIAPAFSAGGYWNNYYDGTSIGYNGSYAQYPLNGVVEVSLVATVPLPPTLILFLSGALGLGLTRIRKWRKVRNALPIS
jgi:hypothetical protein